MKNLLVSVIILQCLVKLNGSGENQEIYSKSFDGVKLHLGLPHSGYFNESDVSSLIRLSMERMACRQRGLDCQCLNVENDLYYSGISAINATTFGKLSVILLAYAKNMDKCVSSPDEVNATNTSYATLLRQFLESESIVAKNDTGKTDIHLYITNYIMDSNKIHKIFKDLNKHYIPGDLIEGVKVPTTASLAQQLHCVNAGNFFDDLGINKDSEIDDQTDYENLASWMIYHIVKGSCFSTTDVAPPHNFLYWLYNAYGYHGRLHHDGLEKLMFDVSVGKPSKRVFENFDLKKCYSKGELMLSYFGNVTTTLDGQAFETLCPAIIQQVASGACIHNHKRARTSTDAQIYGYGTLAVFILCMCTIMGAPFMLIKSKAVKTYLLAIFMALGMGTLCADAILHLVPLALGIHKHAHNLKLADGVRIEVHIWPMLTFLASLYAFFLLDTVMHVLVHRQGHTHSHDIDSVEVSNVVNEHSPKVEIKDGDAKKTEDKDGVAKKTHYSALTIMVLVGDSLHNFADGIAIAAAFSYSISGGISTTIAIFFHEVPHELGDFAVLIASGMSIKKAMLTNFISDCAAFLGLYVGLAISMHGNYDTTRKWIFVVAAGLFVYISLADIVPELKRFLEKSTNVTAMMAIQHIGLICGICCMLIIALMEPYIKI